MTAAGTQQELNVQLGVADFDTSSDAVDTTVASVLSYVHDRLVESTPGSAKPQVAVEALRDPTGGLARLLVAIEPPSGWVIASRGVIGKQPFRIEGPEFKLGPGTGMIPTNQRSRFQRYWLMVLCFAEAATLRAKGTAGSEVDRWIDDADVVVSYDWTGGDVSPGTVALGVSLAEDVAGMGSSVSISLTRVTGFDGDHVEIVQASDFNPNSTRAPKNAGRFCDDVNRLLIEALRSVEIDPETTLMGYSYIVPAIPSIPGLSEPEPAIGYRAFNRPQAIATDLRGGQLSRTTPAPTRWTALFVGPRGSADIDPTAATFIHETGHALGLPDLYFQHGFRRALRYLEDWSPMDKQRRLPHHCAPHKLELGWIPAGRVLTFSRLTTSEGRCDAWLAPVELWDDEIAAQLGELATHSGPGVQVAQLIRLGLGGDGLHEVVVEARAPGARFGLGTPPHVLVTNARRANDGTGAVNETRVIVNDEFRRSIQYMADLDVSGTADLGTVPALPAAGVTVRSLETHAVTGADGHPGTAHRVLLEWHPGLGVDLAFTAGKHAWDSPDVWIDWPDDGQTAFPPGQPTDQGDVVRIPKKGGAVEHHAVARVHNLGTAAATQVEVEFDSASPPTAGDQNFVPLTNGTVALVQPGAFAEVRATFPVQVGHPAHFCLKARIKDYGVAGGGGADEVRRNDEAQKNVTRVQVLGSSPYRPAQFQVEVTNAGPVDERAFLIPVGYGEGSRIAVLQSLLLVPAKGSATFDVVLELDEDRVPFGVRNDFSTQLVVWRETDHSCERWGGCTVIVEPRHDSTCSVRLGSWTVGHDLAVAGNVPSATGGTVTVEAYLSTASGPDIRFVQTTLNHLGECGRYHPGRRRDLRRDSRALRRQPDPRALRLADPPGQAERDWLTGSRPQQQRTTRLRRIRRVESVVAQNWLGSRPPRRDTPRSAPPEVG